MNYLYRNRIIFWLLVALVVINCSALVTFFIVRSNHTTPSAAVAGLPPVEATLHRELDLNPLQTVRVDSILYTYRQASLPLADSIRQSRRALLQALSAEPADSLLISKLISTLSNRQAALQLASVGQFLALKKVCNPEQALKLSDLYVRLYGLDRLGHGPGKGEGKGNGKGYRYRHGRSRNN